MTFDKQFYDRFKYLLLQEKLDNLYVVNDEIIFEGIVLQVVFDFKFTFILIPLIPTSYLHKSIIVPKLAQQFIFIKGFPK